MSFPQAPTAYLLSIGEELLEGRVRDTNAGTFATELLQRGFHVVGMRTLGDAPGELTAVLQELAGQVDFILSTGGLGPTVDDRVRAEAAAFAGVPLEVISTEAEASLAQLYQRVSKVQEPPSFFMAQARMPQGATALANHAGSAWGFLLPLAAGGFYAALPGPPRECGATFHQGGLLEFLEEQFGGDDGSLAYGLLNTVGAPESVVESKMRDLLEKGGNPRLGITAGADKVCLSILARAEGGQSAKEVRDACLDELRQRLGDVVFGEGHQSLADVVVDQLKHNHQRLAVAESCTGGQLAAAVTSVPGASAVFHGGFLTYANEAKVQSLGVPLSLLEAHGAVSAEVAAAMAVGARERCGCDWALSTTGVAGPGGGTEDKPVGLVWIGLAGPDGQVHTFRRRQYARGGRAVVQQLSVRDALDALRRAIGGLTPLASTPVN